MTRTLAVCILLVGPIGLFACSSPGDSAPDSDADVEWPRRGGTYENTKYSPLEQIDRDNVGELEVAWVYRTGDEGYTIECNPIVIDDTLYATSPSVNAFALDAATGEELWTFDPYAYEGEEDRMTGSWAVNRGVSHWGGGGEQRIFFGAGPYLYALDARTGQPVQSFGDSGRVDLLEGLDRDTRGGALSMTSPGLVYRDLIIVGARVGEGYGKVPPGHVRAYDVRTGERRWIFHTIPYPGEYGYETWPEDAWKTFGGANAWSGFSLDEERGLVFFGTGSPSHDHFGADRHGKNLFANSVVALDATTGKRVWHYQVVHHDLWDYDIPTPPNLVTVEHEGQRIDAVAQVTKMGFLFLLDRETGEPLFEVEEQPVAQSDVPGEETWPTQPVPTRPAPYARQGFKKSDITNRTAEAQRFVRERVFERYGRAELFDPPSFRGDLVHPQFNGGTDWGGASFDPETGILYVNASNVPEVMRVVETDADSPFPYTVTGHQPVTDPDGFPINTPPWGTLTAIDLNIGEIVWQVPLGTHPDLEGRDRPPTGTFNMGGSIVTAGGLVFIGGSMDERFRAFDKETGEVLWETELPAGGYATPAVYTVDGRQYVVIAAGGGGKPGTRPGDAYVAFALPDPDAASADRDDELGLAQAEQSAGARLYSTRCASCHQFDGQGVPGEFPPLAGTPWVTGDKDRLIRLVLDGLTGEIEVKGTVYDGPMPPWGEFLDDEEMAAMLTHLRTSWGNQASAVTAEKVEQVRSATRDRESPWTAEELRQLD